MATSSPSIYRDLHVLPHPALHCWGHLVLVRSLSKIHTFHQSFEETHWFEAVFKMFGRAVFEVKGGLMVKEQDFEAEISNCVMSIHFSKIRRSLQQYSTLLTFPDFWVVMVDFDPFLARKWPYGFFAFILIFFSASKSNLLTMLHLLISKTAIPKILKVVSNQCISSSD